MAWTDERVELLKTLWAEGLSAAQIANKMGGVTRNAVIGKVHRLGLSGRATPAKPQRGCGPAPVRSKEEAPAKPAPRMEMRSVIPDAESIAPLVLDSGDKTTVNTIKNNMCKWPIGDPAKDDFHFCGQPALTGKSYCTHHARMAFQPPQRRERPEPRRPAAQIERRRAAG
ncbi:GcrA family cell cycle regulator [Hyphococcus sp.]|uniref:GcrA family cell cycle regulator n=1 Tax=Hyphococcus sp. TaxID=2038636 RepID=UPI003CCC3C0E